MSVSRRRPESSQLAPINRNETYPLPVFKARTGLSDWAMRQARRKGLPIITIGSWRYASGLAAIITISLF